MNYRGRHRKGDAPLVDFDAIEYEHVCYRSDLMNWFPRGSSDV